MIGEKSMWYLIMAILAFGILIIVHELGHFIMAKVNGVKVEEFSIGMGPVIYQKKGKETNYSLRLLPIGGYVSMMGEEENVKDERSFSEKSPLRRISIIIAGVCMNYILAVICFMIWNANSGFAYPVISEITQNSAAQEAGLETGDEFLEVNGLHVFTQDDVSVGIALSKGEEINIKVNRNGEEKSYDLVPKKYSSGTISGLTYNSQGTAVESIEENSDAFKAGFQTGDKITEIEGNKISSVEEIPEIIGKYPDNEFITLKVDRNGSEEELTAKPKVSERTIIGVTFKTNTNPGFGETIVQSFKQTASTISQVVESLKMAVTGKLNFKEDVGGPVTIIRMSTQMAKAGLMKLIYWTAFLSLNLAVFNLIPFPALDGGWTLVLLIELITGKKVPDKIIGPINTVGFIILMAFMFIVVLKDIFFPAAL